MTRGSQPKRPLLRRKSTLVVLALLSVVFLGFALSGSEPPPPPRGSGEFMQAIVYRQYGPPDVLRLERTEQWLPEDHQVVIKVRAASANPLDWHYMRGTPYLMRMDYRLARTEVAATRCRRGRCRGRGRQGRHAVQAR